MGFTAIQKIESYLSDESLAEQYALETNPATKALFASGLDLYCQRFDLNRHLSNLEPDGTIWDLGCGTAEAMDTLATKSRFVLLGINYPKLPHPNGRPNRIPIVSALIEEIATKVRIYSEQYNASSPRLMLFSNSFRYPVEFNTHEHVLNEAAKILPCQGKILIYDNLGLEVYLPAIAAIEKIWPVFNFCLYRGDGLFPWYLQLTKSSEARNC